ncbi:aspartate ammonia-lyase [Pseudarthrobacter raffinosi]|uniref:aspartate ammonia-lyase n=1 Tax=Pseudarthrobacter raffinosi TaxID=2953651 RepID=UPI00208EDFD2|nr:aspartate ammonia-lyase [Pseudarthrobacter sp. MDT3-9]MCO4253251.1 aspartate ammonia-lyase [Pseudarthrobacter sp. MDT3-9]
MTSAEPAIAHVGDAAVGSSAAASQPTTRIETDLLGSAHVPLDAYWGIHTQRAVENFSLGADRLEAFPALVAALALVKQACARANQEYGLLPPGVGSAIEWACEQLRDGRHLEQFPVEMIQGGAGTSTNMNVNEVIANLALERLGLDKGTYAVVHPNEQVNKSQSTNDVYPTALKIAMITSTDVLIASLDRLTTSCDRKAAEFGDIVKMGRTQLQDAVPMTLGQEFETYGVTLRRDRDRLLEAAAHLHEVNLGATAIGTGITAPSGFASSVGHHLRELTGRPMRTSDHLIESTQDVGTFTLFSATLKRLAVKLSKICNDLRLLSSGPRSGLGEINLPPRQAGSSIMPGKVNPVMPEFVNQIAFEVIGSDLTVTLAAESGQLQLNAFEPIIAYSIFRSMAHLSRAMDLLADYCIDGITANTETLAGYVDGSISIVTALVPQIGYVAATDIANEAQRTGASVKTLVLELGLLTPEAFDELILARPNR